MSQRKSKKSSASSSPSGVQHAGRVTVTECRARGRGLACAPLNRVTTWDERGRMKEHCTCTCGRRFRVGDANAAEHLVEPAGPITEVAPGASADWPAADLWPADGVAEHAVVGVVAIGTEVLHEPTRPVGAITDDVKAFAKHLVKVMHAAPGVGLAANQVGMPVRMFVQLHKRAAPETLVDPEIRATAGTWRYEEGCLSLEVPGSRAEVIRPRRLQVRFRTLHGETVEVTADEVLARIFQHEIDHLDGTMYLQRTVPPTRDAIDAVIEAVGIDPAVVPPRPYPSSDGDQTLHVLHNSSRIG